MSKMKGGVYGDISSWKAAHTANINILKSHNFNYFMYFSVPLKKVKYDSVIHLILKKI